MALSPLAMSPDYIKTVTEKERLEQAAQEPTPPPKIVTDVSHLVKQIIPIMKDLADSRKVTAVLRQAGVAYGGCSYMATLFKQGNINTGMRITYAKRVINIYEKMEKDKI